jgi:hypothetical protein
MLKNFFVRNIGILVISLSVCPQLAFPVCSNKHSSLVWKLKKITVLKSFIALVSELNKTNKVWLKLNNDYYTFGHTLSWSTAQAFVQQIGTCF